MIFSYWDYFVSNLMLPVFALAFIAVPVFNMVRRVLLQVANGEPIDMGGAKMVILFVLLIAIAVILANFIFHGGIQLVFDRPSKAVTVEGTIQDIDALNALEGVRYSSNDEMSYGYTYTIDGVTCTGMAKGTLEVGDAVIATYLPKSGFVLSIDELNP